MVIGSGIVLGTKNSGTVLTRLGRKCTVLTIVSVSMLDFIFVVATSRGLRSIIVLSSSNVRIVKGRLDRFALPRLGRRGEELQAWQHLIAGRDVVFYGSSGRTGPQIERRYLRYNEITLITWPSHWSLYHVRPLSYFNARPLLVRSIRALPLIFIAETCSIHERSDVASAQYANHSVQSSSISISEVISRCGKPRYIWSSRRYTGVTGGNQICIYEKNVCKVRYGGPEHWISLIYCERDEKKVCMCTGQGPDGYHLPLSPQEQTTKEQCEDRLWCNLRIVE